MATSSSRVRSKDTSSPACSLASSIMEARRQSPDRFTGVPWYSILRVPQAASAAALMQPSVRFIMESRSPQAS